MQTVYTFSYNPAISTGANIYGVNWRMAYRSPLYFYKGITNTFKIVVFSPNQRVVDLSNAIVEISVIDLTTNKIIITKQAVIDTPLSGVSVINIEETDLTALDNRFYLLTAKLIKQDSTEILYLDDNYGAFTNIILEDSWNLQDIPTV